ncbi:hypothetical protein, partial [Bradyrhizobium vignae]
MACNLLHFSVTHSWHGYFCSARAIAVNPARAAPLRASGVDRDSGAKQVAFHAKNAQERVSVRAPWS